MKRMNRILCIALCVCLLCGLTIPVSANGSADNVLVTNSLNPVEGDDIVASKNVETGEVTYSQFSSESQAYSRTAASMGEIAEGWFPDVENFNESNDSTQGNNQRNVLGDDDRIKVTNTEVLPYSAICYIEIDWPDGSTSVGTAWMIYSDVAVTAGHCVYSTKHGGWAQKIKLWPGKDGYGLWNNPYGTTEVSNMHASANWTSSANQNFDWAVLELEDNIGNQTGWFGFGWSVNSLTGTTVTISGYPSEYRYYQYKMTDEITNCTTNKLYYNVIDTSGGQSGSPIYTSNNISYGIHCYGGETENSGTRITEWLFDYLSSFRD